MKVFIFPTFRIFFQGIYTIFLLLITHTNTTTNTCMLVQHIVSTYLDIPILMPEQPYSKHLTTRRECSYSIHYCCVQVCLVFGQNFIFFLNFDGGNKCGNERKQFVYTHEYIYLLIKNIDRGQRCIQNFYTPMLIFSQILFFYILNL